jgi:hypothetical protein
MDQTRRGTLGVAMLIVLVESNFVLELALEQEEAGHADAIVRLASERSIELVVPAWSLGEPYETLGRRTKDREATVRTLQREALQLVRSRSSAHLAKTAESLCTQLTKRSPSEGVRRTPLCSRQSMNTCDACRKDRKCLSTGITRTIPKPKSEITFGNWTASCSRNFPVSADRGASSTANECSTARR